MLERDEPADGAEHLLHGRRAPEELGNLRRAASTSIDTVRLLRRAAHEVDRLVDVERLGQVLEGSALVRGHGGVRDPNARS